MKPLTVFVKLEFCELEDLFPALSRGAHTMPTLGDRCSYRLFLLSAPTLVRPAAPILEQHAAERAEQQLSWGKLPGKSVIYWRHELARATAGHQPWCGWEVGIVLILQLGKPSLRDVVLRRWWNQGHCYPARTPSTTPHHVLLIAEMKKIPVFAHDRLESLEILQSVCWGCCGH